MTPRERWLALLDGKRPDRVPCDYWATAEVTRRLLGELGCRSERELWEALDIDKCIFLAPRHLRAKEDTWHIPSLFSVWNIETALVPYMDGLGVYEEAVNPPLAQVRERCELESFPWPCAEDWDTSQLRDECLQWRDYPIVGASYEPFYLYCRLRGMDQALEDLLVNPDIVDAAMERIFEIHAGIVRRTMKAAGDLIDFIYVAEDLGTQQSLLMSPAAFRRFIRPWLARMVEIAQGLGARVFHHDDGAIYPLLPDLVEIGIDLLNPVQWRCRGMDRRMLAREFGGALVFHGGIDNQRTLPFGSPQDVRREVAENIEIFRQAKGYIIAPCHNLQANTPTENIIALYDAVKEFGS
jgi:uroporphyrinogen decarboxylase